jgi:hypothetical protein
MARRLLNRSGMKRYLLISLFAACHANPDTTPDAPITPVDSSGSGGIAFSYTPAWSGVVSVDVIGAFGQAGDWTTPLLSLTESSGTWTGSAPLADGTYSYLFHVVGDDAVGSDASSYERYVFDPASTGYAACPAESPTSGNDANPCGQLTVPVVAPALQHVTGRAVVDGSAVANFLVVVERQEADSHHFFVNRSTTGADGSYDFAVASGGSYRIQVMHPDYLAKQDADLDPVAIGTLRRTIAARFPVTAAVAVSDAEMAFHDYALFAPSPSATLPTTFTFTSGVKSSLEVYGSNAEIGDPWFDAMATKTGHATFDGAFNTPKAKQPNADMDKRYWWGVEQTALADDHGIVWTAQSLAFPITWSELTSN